MDELTEEKSMKKRIVLFIIAILGIAATGLLMPKTSTRAITSPSGTADSMEVLASVSFTKEEILNILESEKAGIFWAGAMNSAPAADIFLRPVAGWICPSVQFEQHCTKRHQPDRYWDKMM